MKARPLTARERESRLRFAQERLKQSEAALLLAERAVEIDRQLLARELEDARAMGVLEEDPIGHAVAVEASWWARP